MREVCGAAGCGTWGARAEVVWHSAVSFRAGAALLCAARLSLSCLPYAYRNAQAGIEEHARLSGVRGKTFAHVTKLTGKGWLAAL